MRFLFRSALTAALLASAAAVATGQSCEPQKIGGSISAADGSSPPTLGVELCGTRVAPEPGLSCGNTTMSSPEADGAQGSWLYNASSPYYLVPPPTPGASCDYDPNPPHCLSCSGSFSIQLYALYGNIKGTVFGLYDQGMASVGVIAPAIDPNCSNGLNTLTDANGDFSFTNGASPAFAANHWAVGVTGDGTGPGTCDYAVKAGGDCQRVTVSSSQDSVANLYLTANRQCDMRPRHQQTPQGPIPAVGKPVSVLTGNVFFSQTDAVIPGIAGLELVREYNSQNAFASVSGAFGRGWTQSYEQTLTQETSFGVMLRERTGVAMYFQDRDGDSRYDPSRPITEESWIIKESGGSYVRHFRQGGTESYDTQGRLTSTVDAVGNTTSLTRDGSGRIVTIAAPGGRSLTLAYNASGKVSTLSGPTGVLAAYAYDAQGMLQAVSYPDGSGYTFTYDSLGQVLTVLDATGRVVETHTYDAQGRGLTSEIADGREKYTLAYDDFTTTVTDGLGTVTVYEMKRIHGMRYVTKISGPCSGCGGGGGQVQEWAYDAMGRLTSHTDGSGNTTTYAYNANGDLETETNELDQTTSYTYDSAGRVLTTSRPGGGLTTLTHGSAGPLTITEKVDATTNRTTTLTYTTAGKPETITDPRNKTTTLAYNSTGDLTSVTDPLTHATTFGYDSMGRRTTVTDALNNTTTTTYDARGRVTRITSPDTTHTDFAYDLAGRRTSVTDPLGRTTHYAYDPYGRLASVVDPLNGTTEYGYDLMSNLVSLTDAKGQTTSFEYDGYNRVKKVIYPGGAYETFTYDTGGRLATRVDRKNVTTTYAYDALNRLTGKTYSDGTTPAVSYTYTTAGQLSTAANGTDTLTWTYDLSGQLTSEQSSKNSSTVAYTYDLGGNRLSLSLDGQVFVTYAYDDASRLTTITRGSSSFTFGYDNANRRTSLGYPNGVNTTYSYDTLSRLTNLTAAISGTTVTSSAYTYDAAGNRLTKTHPDYAESYVYDALYRLREVNRTGLTKHWIYNYDAVGNRLSEQVDNSVSTYAYNEKNQLLSTTGGGLLRFRGTLNEPGTVTVNGQPAQMLAGNTFEAYVDVPTTPTTVPVVATDTSGNATTKNYQVTGAGSAATYSYDLNGNLVQKVEGSDTWTYEWNAENQLKRVLKNAVEQARFAYDPQGRRVERVAGGTTTLWAYDGEDIVRETVGTGTLRYVHGSSVDESLAPEDGTGVLSYVHPDGLGSVIRTTTGAGAPASSRRYDAFGNLEIGGTSGHAFTGREWDAPLGLAYYRARYYDPEVGRFISEDPLKFVGGVNFYGYVGNRPTVFRDPSGLLPTPWGVWDTLTACPSAYFTAESMGNLLWKQKIPKVGKASPAQDEPDKRAHCLAFCHIGKGCGGLLGLVLTEVIGNLKETGDSLCARLPAHQRAQLGCGSSGMDPRDMEANMYGYKCPSDVDCESRCADPATFWP
jgi:RHS repeat-associated protein